MSTKWRLSIWYFIQMLVRVWLSQYYLCVMLSTFCYSFINSTFSTTVLASTLICPKRWFWNYSIGFLKDIKMIDLIRQIHILKIWYTASQHWIPLAENNMRSMELSGHKDHKPPPIYLCDVFPLPCAALHCSLLSSLGGVVCSASAMYSKLPYAFMFLYK